MMALGAIILIHIGFRFSAQDAAYFVFPALPYHFSLIYVWFGMPIAWNGPTWSLSAELFAYLLFPFLRFVLQRLPQSSILWSALLLALIQFWFLFSFGLHSTGPLALLRAVSGFVVGMTLGLSTAEVFRASTSANIAGAAVILLIASGFLYVAVIPAAFLILTLAKQGSGIAHRVLSSRITVWLGRISYSIYLLHAPLLIVSLIVLKHVHRLQTDPGLILFSIAYFAIVLAISSCSYNLIENPSRYAIQKLWRMVSPNHNTTRRPASINP
jgi:peptidoglycan/LPS O-acetylase OafA/YrhL